MNKTEYQKMLAGEYYLSTDKALMQKRTIAKQTCFELNQCSPADTKTKKRLLKALMPNAKGLWLETPFYCDYGENIHCNGSVFLNHNITVLDGAKITIGSGTLVGPGTVFAATSHAIEPEQRKLGVCISREFAIGENVWIGANATILGGVAIGNNAIIGAGAVVRQDVGEGETIK
ncbi:MAG: sugar O-acetyltransferase [Pseudomonadota bacterium]